MAISLTEWWNLFLRDLKKLEQTPNLAALKSWKSAMAMAKEGIHIEDGLSSAYSCGNKIDEEIKNLGKPFKSEHDKDKKDQHLPDVGTPEELLVAVTYYLHLQRYQEIDKTRDGKFHQNIILNEVKKRREIVKDNADELWKRIDAYLNPADTQKALENKQAIISAYPQLENEKGNTLYEKVVSMLSPPVEASVEDRLMEQFEAEVQAALEKFRNENKDSKDFNQALIDFLSNLGKSLLEKETILREIAIYKKFIEELAAGSISPADLKQGEVEKIFNKFVEELAIKSLTSIQLRFSEIQGHESAVQVDGPVGDEDNENENNNKKKKKKKKKKKVEYFDAEWGNIELTPEELQEIRNRSESESQELTEGSNEEQSQDLNEVDRAPPPIEEDVAEINKVETDQYTVTKVFANTVGAATHNLQKLGGWIIDKATDTLIGDFSSITIDGYDGEDLLNPPDYRVGFETPDSKPQEPKEQLNESSKIVEDNALESRKELENLSKQSVDSDDSSDEFQDLDVESEKEFEEKLKKLTDRYPHHLVEKLEEIDKTTERNKATKIFVTAVNSVTPTLKKLGGWFSSFISYTIGSYTPRYVKEKVKDYSDKASSFVSSVLPVPNNEDKKNKVENELQNIIQDLAIKLNYGENSSISGNDFTKLSSEKINEMADKVAIVRHMVHIQKCLALYRQSQHRGVVAVTHASFIKPIVGWLSTTSLRYLIHDRVLLTLEAEKLEKNLGELIKEVNEKPDYDRFQIGKQFNENLVATEKEANTIQKKSLYSFFAKNEVTTAKKGLVDVMEKAKTDRFSNEVNPLSSGKR